MVLTILALLEPPPRFVREVAAALASLAAFWKWVLAPLKSPVPQLVSPKAISVLAWANCPAAVVPAEEIGLTYRETVPIVVEACNFA
jgi:hypothetical protein